MFASAIFAVLFSLGVGDYGPTPKSAYGLCNKYSWACEKTVGRDLSMGEVKYINRKVNAIREISDKRQYGVNDYWSLPGKLGGDCEDFSLEKMRLLLKAGGKSEDFIISTAITNKGIGHAVLLWINGDKVFVLDNLTNNIKEIQDVPYTFLLAQVPTSKDKWFKLFQVLN